MALLDELLTWAGTSSQNESRNRVHYECRRCGGNLSEDDTVCPDCGSGEIASIDL